MLLEIITAESRVYGDDVDLVVAPGVDGQLGILPKANVPVVTSTSPVLFNGTSSVAVPVPTDFRNVPAFSTVIASPP